MYPRRTGKYGNAILLVLNVMGLERRVGRDLGAFDLRGSSTCDTLRGGMRRNGRVQPQNEFSAAARMRNHRRSDE